MRKLLTLLMFLTPLCAAAQGARHDNIAFRTAVPSLSTGVAGAILQPIPNAIVTVCSGSTPPAVGVACSPTTTIYSNIGLSTALSNPTNADGNGNYFFYATSGLAYTISVAGSGLTTYSYVWTAPTSLSAANTWTLLQTFILGPVAPSIGPSVTQQHTLPVVASDTFALLNAVQTLVGKSLTNPTSTGTDSGTEALTNKTLDISLNTLKTATNTTGHYPRNNGTQYLDSTVAAAGVGSCSGVQFPQVLIDNAAPTCVTPPTFVASGASHAVGYVPDPGSVAGTLRFLREDATFSAPPQVVNSVNTSTISSDVTFSNSATTITSKAVTMPSTGGPWRALVSYAGYSGPSNNQIACWVSDATNTFAGSQTGSTTTLDIGQNASEISPVTYANSAAITFTWLCQASNATSVSIKAAPRAGAGPNSRLVVTIMSSN